MPEPSRIRRIFNDSLYRLTHGICRLVTVLFLEYRVEGQDKMPSHGPVLILSNHQSTLDPILVGILFQRKLVYLAKKSLFSNPLFGFLIRSYDSIPIDRERGGLDGLREILNRLKSEKAVLIFPEGTRSRNGELLPVKGGFLSVAKRSQATLLPLAVVGGNEIMQKGKLFPRRSQVAAYVGNPIPYADYANKSDEETLACVSAEMLRCWTAAHELRTFTRST